MPAIVTLLTDFGLADSYVGQVKGAILAIAPSAQLVDLTHAIPPQDVQAGAFVLWTAVEVFPAGSLHLAVVDPGVGSARRAIAARARRGDVLIGPDNGLLGPAIELLGGLDLAVELTNPTYWRPRPSRTFHGRDIFGPVAGHLAAGVPLHHLGHTLVDVERPFAFPQPRREGARLVGAVLHVDAFGTLVTNVPVAALPERFTVTLGSHTIVSAPHQHFQAVGPGEPLALVGSAGLLEVAVREGHAASALQVRRGDPVVVQAA